MPSATSRSRLALLKPPKLGYPIAARFDLFPGALAGGSGMQCPRCQQDNPFDAPRGEAHYREALALAEPRGMRPLVAHCHLGLGKLYQRTGQRRQAQEHLATATVMYREMDMRSWVEQAEAAA
jgi:hypothetical protein